MNPRLELLMPALAALTVVALVAAGDSGPVDRVGFPAGYRSSHTVIRHDYLKNRSQVITVFANAPAASVTDLQQLPYPQGSVIVFEYAEPVKDVAGAPAQDGGGVYQKGPIVRVDVMRREAGHGEVYGASRAGEWEFASYFPDGRSLPLPDGAAACAKCHQRAGAGRDFVFRGRFPPLRQP